MSDLEYGTRTPADEAKRNPQEESMRAHEKWEQGLTEQLPGDTGRTTENPLYGGTGEATQDPRPTGAGRSDADPVAGGGGAVPAGEGSAPRPDGDAEGHQNAREAVDGGDGSQGAKVAADGTDDGAQPAKQPVQTSSKTTSRSRGGKA